MILIQAVIRRLCRFHTTVLLVVHKIFGQLIGDQMFQSVNWLNGTLNGVFFSMMITKGAYVLALIPNGAQKVKLAVLGLRKLYNLLAIALGQKLSLTFMKYMVSSEWSLAHSIFMRCLSSKTSFNHLLNAQILMQHLTLI